MKAQNNRPVFTQNALLLILVMFSFGTTTAQEKPSDAPLAPILAEFLDGDTVTHHPVVKLVGAGNLASFLALSDCKQEISEDTDTLHCNLQVKAKSGLRGFDGRFVIEDEAGQVLIHPYQDANPGRWSMGETIRRGFMLAYSDIDRKPPGGAVHLKNGVLLRVLKVRFELTGLIDGRGGRHGKVPRRGFQEVKNKNFSYYSNMFRQKHLDDILPPKQQQFLREADHLELILTSGDLEQRGASAPVADTVLGKGNRRYPVLKSVSLDDPLLRDRFLTKFFRGIGRSNGTMGCFLPAYALRARTGDQRMDLIICFHCRNFEGKGPDGDLSGSIYTSPSALFAELLHTAGPTHPHENAARQQIE